LRARGPLESRPRPQRYTLINKTVIVVMTLTNETKNVGDCPELYSEKDYLG